MMEMKFWLSPASGAERLMLESFASGCPSTGIFRKSSFSPGLSSPVFFSAAFFSSDVCPADFSGSGSLSTDQRAWPSGVAL